MRTTRELRSIPPVAALALSLLAAGCGGGPPAGSSASSAGPSPEGVGAGVPAAAMDEARQVFKTRCVACHGDDGAGDGPAAAALNPKPRDYRSVEWQQGVTDEAIEKIIVGGGPSVGKSPLMPPNPDLLSKPDVVRGLRAIVRGFKGK